MNGKKRRFLNEFAALLSKYDVMRVVPTDSSVPTIRFEFDDSHVEIDEYDACHMDGPVFKGVEYEWYSEEFIPDIEGDDNNEV